MRGWNRTRYVERVTLAGDVGILARCLAVLLRGEGTGFTEQLREPR
ncbi:hypothetical protein OF850_12735 [Roseococcus sp. MDT2-1-1]|uniref:Uncharacterized protein n=1 Tax=Sabulicella glaciei TaxID=2984948 RepID=A0ABT3NY57_9PROT|nr:hypothetical protein [Roseococcus sp. MDT2-1-1]